MKDSDECTFLRIAFKRQTREREREYGRERGRGAAPLSEDESRRARKNLSVRIRVNFVSGIIRRAKEIGIAKNSRDTGVEFHMKYTRHLLPPPGLGPLQRRKRIINRTFSLSCPPCTGALLCTDPFSRSLLADEPRGSVALRFWPRTDRERPERPDQGARRPQTSQCYNLLYNLVRISRKY